MTRMSREDTYSRFVVGLKLLLPLVALAILSTLFLVAETLDPEAAIPYADVDVERILEDQGITKPAFGGITEDGAQVSLSAESVRPEEDLFLGKALDLQIVLPGGGEITVVSPAGSVDIVSEEAVLSGGVEINSSSGYDLRTENIRTAWSALVLETDEPIEAKGPAGQIVAGRMHLSATEAPDQHLLVFNEGVRLIYVPNR